MRKISLFHPYIPVLLVYGYILELWYMQNHQAGKATVSFYIFTFNHAFIHFCSLFYNDFFYEFIAMFSTKKNDNIGNINNNDFIFIYISFYYTNFLL